MKRRVLSLIVTLALCLNLCPVWVLAADEETGGGLCPHHPAHTEACGYVPPELEQECSHNHDDGCYTTETDCIHEHTAECYPDSEDDSERDEPVLCTHTCTEDSGCITQTLSCTHEHDDSCGYAPGNPGAPCTFVCRICPIDDLIGKLPSSVSEDNSEQVQAQLSEIYALYDELTDEEQQQVDLSPCVSLLDQIDGMESSVQSDTSVTSGDSSDSPEKFTLDSNQNFSTPYMVSKPMIINTKEYILSGSGSSAIQVTETGELYFMGKITSDKGAGVEVQSGGFLSITEPGTEITVQTYALDIASNAEVQLSTGTYFGYYAAIRTADNDFAALLAPGCAYFDENGNSILPTDVADARKLVIGTCTDHANKTCTHDPGTTTHTWLCPACGTEEPEACTFTFQSDGTGTCVCGNSIAIVVDEDDLTDLVYDGTIKPEDVSITVTLTDGSNKVLTKGDDGDYKVEYVPRVDAGEITVTVTGLTFHGTFTKTYQVDQDRPGLSWDTNTKPVPVTLDYDGSPAEPDDLPPVKINIQSTIDHLEQYLQYSYKKPGDAGYTDGLPTNAGTYEVIVSLPEMPNFEASVSAPITLIIDKISPVLTPPAATRPVFNGASQALVTPGTLQEVAVRDGVEILFSDSENGSYSTTIPTGINAGNYTVWYQTEGSENYLPVGPAEVQNVEIQRKTITPIVTLSEYTYLYDGGEHEPKVTVKDEDDVTVLLDTEYAVDYVNNRNVSTPGNPAKVVVTDKPGGNYDLTRVEVEFKITIKTQDALSIIPRSDPVTYGDKFTLGTTGGSGNGLVTWAITDGMDVATVDPGSGQITVTGHGSATVQATKSGKDPNTGVTNYEDAIAAWTFTADKKAVTATVTAEDKTYNGDDIATIHAVVEQGVLPRDEITITGLTGTFSDTNAGVNKTVRVDVSGALISGNNSQHYDVSYSSLTVTATIRKAIATIKTAPDAAILTYNGTAQALIDASNLLVDPSGILVEYALSEDGPYSTTIPEETNAGTYTVWYRVQETANYTGLAPASVDVTIQKKPVNPSVTLSGDGLTTEADGTYSYIYDGTAKTPDVTLTEADGTTVIPDTEYTVSYRNNTNVGNATVTVTAKAGGNYSFTPVPQTFAIQKQKAQVVTAPKMAGDPLTYNTRAQELVTEGTGSGGTMVYSLVPIDLDDPDTYLESIPRATDAADYTVYYMVKGDSNHSDSDMGQVTVTIEPKTVKDPTIELYNADGTPLVSYTYDGTPKKPTIVVLDGSTVIGTVDPTTGENNEYNVICRDNIDAGTATVNITDKVGGNYTITGSTTFVIVKADIVFNPAPAAANITYDGKAHELLSPGTPNGGEVLYALDSPNTTFTAAIPTATEAGDYIVYYKVTGGKNFNDLSTQSVPVTIQRKPLTAVTIELDPDSFVYDGQMKLPKVTVKDGNTVLPEEEYAWKCTQNGTEVTAPTNQGTYTVEISDLPDGNYDLTGVTANTKTFNIGKSAQAELVIENKPATTNYGDTFTLTATGGSGTGTVSWSVTGGPATVDSNGAVEITGVGEVTITATNPGDQNYLPISAQWTFTAAPKPVTASVSAADKFYDGTTDATVTSAGIASGDLVNSSDVVTIDPASITAAFDTPSVGTGKTVTLDTSKVKVTGADADKYAITYPAAVTATITQATTTITIDPAAIAPLTYNTEPQVLVTAGETNVGFLVYSLNGTDFSPELPTGTNAGTYTVYYKVDGTADYTGVAVNTTLITVTIAPKAITPVVEPEESSYLYDSTRHEPKLTVKDGKTVIDEDQYTVTWTNDDPAITTDILTAAGSYTAAIQSVANGNYSFTATAKVEINPASQAALNITGQPEHVYYGDEITTLHTTGGSGNGTLIWTITASGGNSTIDPATGELTVKDTGSITVKAERVVPNYGNVSDTWTFTVEPKPVTAEVTVTAKDYDGTTAIDPADIVATVNPSDLVDPGDTFTISGLEGAYTSASAGTGKTVTLDASKATTTADTSKYAVSYPAAVKADIDPRTVTVTVTLSGNDLQTDASGNPYYDYDGADKTPTVTVTCVDGTYSATLAPSDFTFSYLNNRNVGTASVTVKCAAGGNYDFPDETVTFAIKSAAAKLTSTPQAKNLTYDGTDQDLVTVGVASGGTVVYSLLPIDPDDPSTYSETIPQGQNAGVYTVYYMVKGDANHDDTAPSQVSVTIKPKEVVSPVVTVSGTYIYDGTPQVPGASDIKVEDGSTTIPSGEYNVTFRDNTDAGTATVVITNANGGNYIVNGTGTFTIAKANVAAADITPPTGRENLPYNGSAQALITAGSADGGTMVYSLSQTGEYSAAIPAETAVGSYKVWYKVQGDANHNDTTPVSVDASIIVNTVSSPNVQVDPPAVTYTGEKQEPTVTVKDDSGVIIDGSEYTVTYADAGGSTVTNLTNVGKYTLTITATGSNYSFTATGSFEILPADQTPLTITGTRDQVYYGDTIQLGTTGGNGTVTWAVDDSNIAAISSSGLLTITGVGSVTVTATSSAPGYTDQTATWPLFADRKPVTAVVTAATKTYDATTTAAVTAALQSSDLVGNDVITIKLSGSFEDPNAGTNKKVTVDSTSPDFTGSTGDPENYNITYPATTTASILKVDIDAADVTAPTAETSLSYTGDPLALVQAGSAAGGTLEYSIDNITYSVSLPTGTSAGDYNVWYRVRGDSNHNDVDAVKLGSPVTIAQQTVTAPIIELNPNSVSYDGGVHKPTVTVKDNNGRVIPDTEYTVTYGNSDWKTVGDHTVTVDNKTGGNYDVTTGTKDFTILMMGQNPLSIGNQPGKVQYGDSFTLTASGGSGTGAITWASDRTDIASITSGGTVTVLNAGGPVTITATKAADDNYGAASVTWTFNAEKKPVIAVVSAKNKVYDGNSNADLVVTWQPGDLLSGDSIDLASVLTGAFDDPNAGTGKVVRITGTLPENSKYAVTWNTTTTASITPKTATVSGVTIKTGLIYNRQAQALVTEGTATGGNVAYSLDGTSYTLNVPTQTNAGTYTVWYKAQADGPNYQDSAASRVSVTIAPKTVDSPVIELDPDTFEYDGTAKKPDVTVKDNSVVIPTSEYTVGYSNNTAVGTTAKVTITNADGGNYVVNGTANFTIRAGAAQLVTPPQPNALTYNGSYQALVTGGTAVNGQVVYATAEAGSYSLTIPSEINAGSYQVWYKVQGANGASDTAPASINVTIQPKQVTPNVIVTQSTVTYDGTAQTPPVFVLADSQMLTQDTDYKVLYSNNTNPGTATVIVWSMSGGNYQFTASATFEIVKEKASFAATPTGKTGLVYNGTPQELVTPGTPSGGTVRYSLDDVSYSAAIPTGTERKTYTIYAKVVGDSNHLDSDVISFSAEIKVNAPQSPTVVLPDSSFRYTGSEITPPVTVYDDNNNIIPATEYTVTYSDNINAGTAKITITSKGSNYSFTANATFTITGAGQTPLEITGKKDTVYYGDTLSLGTAGGDGGGAVSWTVTGPVTNLGSGQFKITSGGSCTITATKAASGSYEAASATWTFVAQPKPVKAAITAASRPYNANTDVTLTVTISSGLVSGDVVNTVTATGHFTDADVGTNKTVVIDTVTIPEGVREKYDITWDATTTASITPAAPTVTAPTVVARTLTYDGTEQPLLADAGSATGGTLQYSLDRITYSYTAPTAKNAGVYTVWYKVAADENYKDTTPAQAGTVTISPNTDRPTVLCRPNSFPYDGTQKTPDVVVLDSKSNIIPDSEYTVTVDPAIAVGTYKVTVKDKTGGNYEFSTDVEGTFQIVAASQNPLSIITDIPTNVFYGDTFRLSAMGGSGSGAIVWSITGDTTAATITTSGVVTVTGTGGFTVNAYRAGADGYSDSNTDSVPFVANKKTVTPVVTAASKPYDGTPTVTLTAKFKDGDLVGSDTITLTVEGQFDSSNVGTSKQVSITKHEATGTDAGKYTILWPETTTAEIYKVDAKLSVPPSDPGLTYTGSAQALVTPGSTVNGIGTIEYSTTQNGAYSTAIPTATSAGTYTVWYRVADSVNYTGIPAAPIQVEIKKADPGISTQPTATGTTGQKLSDIRLEGGATTAPGKFAWKDGSITPSNGASYDVIFTPNDTANYETVTFQVQVTLQSSSSSDDSDDSDDSSDTPVRTTVQDGAASTVLSAAEGSRLVREAAASQSQAVVIKPEISGDVTKAAVSIPTSTVRQLESTTDADLTVSTPIADVTIPNAALDTLSSAGGAVSVVTEQVDQAVVLTLTAGGESVENIPVTLTVPAEDAGPGTVAVLVHEDGTRETIRKSVVEDGKLNIPLSGSATVEIVDNSKEFADVPDSSWAADAVAFASAHELFSGTSETTFSPDQAISRGMLVTVLYSLEGRPEQAQTSEFSDVSSDAWYADSVAWATENGITDGYGNGQFGPNDSLTREQFVVMLWKYAGSPEASDQVLDFTDAGQASGYALEALCWAVENGILSGYSNGQLAPGGTATRAQAAQMLKNFMENA